MKIYLFSTPTCGMCWQVKRYIEKHGWQDRVEVVDCTSDDGSLIAGKYSISHVPTLVVDTPSSLITCIKYPEILKALETYCK